MPAIEDIIPPPATPAPEEEGGTEDLNLFFFLSVSLSSLPELLESDT
jgi:hypothetical protein